MQLALRLVEPFPRPARERIERLGYRMSAADPETAPLLDRATVGEVYLVPASLMDDPAWRSWRVRLAHSSRAFIVCGDRGESVTVVRAMRDGAFDFVYFDEPVPRWRESLTRAAESQELWLNLYGSHRTTAAPGGMVGDSPAMLTLLRSIERVSPTPAGVLIVGESGTGKERVAQAVHEASGLRGSFVAINCAAIPRDLLEAELFGAEKGAYTGAVQPRAGLVEQAAGGTLFLDEIGELDVTLQPKLLRFIESRRARRVGGKAEYQVNARLIAATNRELERCIDEGTFRADLYYRLSEVTLKVPPLRNHREDIPLLSRHFLDEANERFGKHFDALEPGLVQAFLDHAWTGNVRELRTTVHRLVLLHDGSVLRREWWEPAAPPAPLVAARSSPRDPAPTTPTGPLNRKQRFERARQLLEESGDDRTWTSSQLGVHPTTLFRWIQSGKVSPPGSPS